MASRSWLSTIRRERIRVERSLKDNPGLKPRLPVLFIEAYDDGREEALIETGLDHLPPQPELTLDQVRDKAFIPRDIASAMKALPPPHPTSERWISANPSDVEAGHVR